MDAQLVGAPGTRPEFDPRPACGMAQWGRAMVLLDNPFIWPAGLTAQKLNDVVAALDATTLVGCFDLTKAVANTGRIFEVLDAPA